MTSKGFKRKGGQEGKKYRRHLFEFCRKKKREGQSIVQSGVLHNAILAIVGKETAKVEEDFGDAKGQGINNIVLRG